MAIRLSIIAGLLMAVLSYSMAGCSLPRCAKPIRLAAQDQRGLPSKIEARCQPVQSTLVHRNLVRAGSRLFDLTCYLKMELDGSWQAVALGDMGTKVFQLSYDGELGKIVHRPAGFPSRPLLDGVVGDIQHLFGRLNPRQIYLAEDVFADRSCDNGVPICVVVEHDACNWSEYYLKADGALVSSRTVDRGKIVRLVEYIACETNSGASGDSVERIVLRNRRLHYTMELTMPQETSQ